MVPQLKVVITRAEAKSSGLKTFFTGKPCNHGHVAERSVKGKHCMECSRVYNTKGHYTPHPDHEKNAASKARKEAMGAGSIKYTGRPCKKCGGSERYVVSKLCVSCEIERSKRKAALPGAKEQAAIKSRKSYLKNRDKVLEKGRIRASETDYGKVYYEENKTHILISVKEWIKANPERRIVYAQNRRRPGEKKLTPADVERIAKSQNLKCAVCRISLKKTGRHIDHIVPVVRGGTSDPKNIQLLCPTCNRSKGAKDAIAFMQSRGMLL